MSHEVAGVRSILRLLPGAIATILRVAVAVAVAIATVSGHERPAPSRAARPAAVIDAAARSSTGAVSSPGPSPVSAAASAYANLPVAFVENRGQIDARVRYYARGQRYAFYLTRDGIAFSFLDRAAGGAPGASAAEEDASGVALNLRFPGSSARRTLIGDLPAGGSVNYFRGPDSSQWRTGIPRYAQVVYRELWPGIDLMLREQGGTLKYEFRVRPGARPADIRLAYDGAEAVAIDAAGTLAIETALGTLRDAAPVSFQMIDGVRTPVDSRYVLTTRAARATSATSETSEMSRAAHASEIGETKIGQTEIGFAIGAGYRPDRELIIDPGVAYSTFLGGASNEAAAAIQVDAAGNVYVVGTTQSPDFPTTPGAYKRTGAPSNFSDVFVSKLNAAGTALIYSTFIGGSDFDFGRDLAPDAAGNVYITGQTKSSSFPTTGGAFDRTFNVDTCPRCGIDQYDAFVTKLNASGSGLVYSTFLGGFDIDDGIGIAVDGAGNAYVTGETGSTNFPTTASAFDRTRNGAFDAFVTKLNATGSALVYSTYLGGTAVEFGSRVAVDAGGAAYVMGSTSSPDFPTTAGSLSPTPRGAFDLFVTKLNASGSGLVYSTYLGGSGFDGGGGLAIDAAGNAYIAGGAGSTDFPATPGAFDTISDGSDAFVAKLNPAGSALVFATLLGGSSNDAATGIALDAAGDIWITGSTNSLDFPATPDAFAHTLSGVSDAFVSKLSADGSTLLYATYLGGREADGGGDLAIAPGGAGAVYVAGNTYSLDFPTTAGAFDIVFNGDLTIFWGDAFVTKIATDTGTSTPPSTPPVPAAPSLLSPANNDTPSQPINFDWNDVPGAASYTIQLDDVNTFTAPLIRDQSVTASQFLTGGLAAVPHFWRVRAVNTAGVAGAWSAVRRFTPQEAPPPPSLSTFSTNPSTVVGGNASTGTVVLSTGAPEGGALILLSSSHPDIVVVPASVTAPSNSFTGTFSFTTLPVSTSTVVTITAAYNGTTRTATVTVTPVVTTPPAASLTGFIVNPASVTGGTAAQGVVTVSGGAPAGGAVVALSSSNAGVASIPASVTVTAGATTAFVTVPTTAVSASTVVTFTASYDGTVRTTSLTVNPGTTTPPPQTATLSVSVTGRSGERVTSAPAGISVASGSSGSAAFTTGTSITLTVSNGRDAVWSGACSSGGDKRKSCTFTLTGAATVSANVK